MPIRGVSVDVKMEDDCTRKVITAPTRMARYPVSHGAQGMSALIVLLTMVAM